MDFLVKTSPAINWKSSTVTCYVGNKRYILPTCNISNIDDISNANQFAGLAVDDDVDNSENELSDNVTVS